MATVSKLNYGAPPAPDEFELSVFGPGYGEAIALHCGDTDWLLIDSCLRKGSKEAEHLLYLREIGVNLDSVKGIVATHWHDDHVKGLSTLLPACRNAEIFIPSTFDSNEALAFLSAYSGNSNAKLSGGTKELFSLVRSARNYNYTAHRSLLYENHVSQCRVVALSPLPQATSKFVAFCAQHLPSVGSPVNQVAMLKPNAESIVLHVSFGRFSLLLGSDLEESSALGWTAVCNNAWASSRMQSGAFKVAHHGSEGAHCDKIWSSLLIKEPISVTTPFWNGRVRLPTFADKDRLRRLSKLSFVTSKASSKPDIPSGRLKRMKDICKELTPLNNGFGLVRFRRRADEDEWRHELFGDAATL